MGSGIQLEGAGALGSGAPGAEALADGGGFGGSELVEVESEDRSWSRWDRRIGAGVGGIGAGGGGIVDGQGGIGGSELVEVESEDRSWSRRNRRIGAGVGGIGDGRGEIRGSELVEMGSE
ncbi:hypothetical protein B9Z55_011028 [Caenorhabditis nigoni]|uniref:Uncharacterized protein n=1 Tax=Caenorhabditis nigoni TaxID=1611254 RepID=A0A2G5UIL3_9PELO|nr:hypothetical protein B9Z55_011028 [Caenorhabditis nigoni]